MKAGISVISGFVAALFLAPIAVAHPRSEPPAPPTPPALTTAQQAVWQDEVDCWDHVNSRDLEDYLDLWHPDFTGWRWGELEECAGAAVFLASHAADFVTGITPPVDGGYAIF